MPDVHNVGVANPLRRWRVRHKVTQADLAAGVGVTPSVVSQWEQRRTVPTLMAFHRLHRYTGIPVHVLLRFFVPLPAHSHERGTVVQFPSRIRGIT